MTNAAQQQRRAEKQAARFDVYLRSLFKATNCNREQAIKLAVERCQSDPQMMKCMAAALMCNTLRERPELARRLSQNTTRKALRVVVAKKVPGDI